MKNTDFATHLGKYFTRYLPNERGSSPQTIDSYRYAFILFLEYMETKGMPPEKMVIADFTAFSAGWKARGVTLRQPETTALLQ